MTEGNEGRDRFANRFDFYFAAVGSAVGFGNVWRFPALAFQYGGGAFFIPYIMALFLIGIPVLFLEIVLGQFYQTGDIGSFTSFHKRLCGVGVSSISCAFVLITYYSVLIVWVINAFFHSFTANAPWDNSPNATVATGYFFNDIVGMKTLDADDPFGATRLVGANVGYSALVWFIVWACVAFGIKLTGKITYFTMGFPILLLFIFLGKGASLEGAGDGVVEYIGRWDMQVLSDEPACWSQAVSQIFFSLSVTFGVMTAYASHLPRNEPAFFNTCVVAIANCTFSFVAGFAVFSAIGHLAHLEGKDVVDVDIAGFSLVFGTWPVVFSTFRGGEHWVRLLFLNLVLLGIDSAFSLLEGVVTCLGDTMIFKNVPKWMVSASVCIPGFFLSFIYCTDAGLFWLDVIDYYLNFMLIIVGFFETFGLGWIYGIEEQIKKFGSHAVIAHMAASFGAVGVGCVIWFGVKNDNNIWGGFLAYILFYGAGMIVTWLVLPEKSVASLSDLVFGNILDFKKKVEPVIGFCPYVWCLLVKLIVPQVLIVILINLIDSKVDGGKFDGKSVFGHYGNYPYNPYQVLGILTFCFVAFLFIIGAIFPPIFDILQPHAGICEESKESTKESTKSDEVVEAKVVAEA